MSGQASSGDRPWSIVLASREVWPFVEGGGIGRYMWTAAQSLAPHADVSILTSTQWRAKYEELLEAGDGRLPEGVRFEFVDEPSGDLSPFVSWNHLWSLRLLEGAARLYPDGGPDILEVPDYQAEGFAAAHARRGFDHRLQNTALAVGLHTSAEMCAVLDREPETEHLRVLAGLERFALRFADAILWPGGNTLERYTEFYGSDSLAAAIRRPLPAPTDLRVPASMDRPPETGPLRLLYLNRLQELKGIAELVTAVRSLPGAELTLTVVGRDTRTGPDQSSMRAHVKELIANDPRIELRDQIPHSEVPDLIAKYHAVVVPSRWESSPYVVREALACNRPVMATPVGWIPEAVRPGESGWLARSSDSDDLAAALREVLAARRLLTKMIADGLPRAVFDELASDNGTRQAYLQLLERRAGAARDGRPKDAARLQVGALIACEAGGGDPLPTLQSLNAQHDVSVSPVLVVGPSGSFPGPGRALAHAHSVVATPGGRWGRQVGWGHGLARTSEEFVLLAPAGAVLEPNFLRRAVAALAEQPELAWVTALARHGDTPVHAPPGSYALPVAELDASPSVALIRREALARALRDRDVALDREPDLFACLADGGGDGLVLQEQLVASLPRRPARPVVAQR